MVGVVSIDGAVCNLVMRSSYYRVRRLDAGIHMVFFAIPFRMISRPQTLARGTAFSDYIVLISMNFIIRSEALHQF